MPKGICLNLFGTYWALETWWIDKCVINHERIHTAQQRELLFIQFYVLYVLEWRVRLVQYRNLRDAYMNISFEREAYAYGDDLSYLPRRKWYAWVMMFNQKKSEGRSAHAAVVTPMNDELDFSTNLRK